MISTSTQDFAMPDVRTIFNKVLPFVLLVALVAGVRAYELPRGSPEELGFSSARLDYIDQFFSEKVQGGEMAGIVTLVARHGKIVHFTAVGYVDIEKKRKMETDTLGFAAANTHFWIDPQQDMVMVAMTQDMGGAPGEELRGQIRALVYGALTN
jgi:CubicO group peptidase (beta-lactamase class C family)